MQGDGDRTAVQQLQKAEYRLSVDRVDGWARVEEAMAMAMAMAVAKAKAKVKAKAKAKANMKA